MRVGTEMKKDNKSSDKRDNSQFPEVGGGLAIVATPIGNLDDITLRALKVLEEATLIAGEDTRKVKVLLERHGILGKKIICNHIYNEHRNVERLLREIKSGEKLALVSDAGTPCISDPGFLIIREALKNNIEPIIIPGVSAVTFSAMASGLPMQQFAFYGFLPSKKGARHKVLMQIAEEDKTAFIFDSPKRVVRLVGEIVEYVGPDASIALIREATKFHEEVIRGRAEDVYSQIKERNLKGEFVIAISSKYRQEDLSE